MRKEFTEEFAFLSQGMDNAWVQKQAGEKMYNELAKERRTLIEDNDWEKGVYDVSGGHVVINFDGNITFYPEKT